MEAHAQYSPLKFLEAQLELFSNLTQGRNEEIINNLTTVSKRLSWDLCFTAVKDTQLPFSLRTRFVQLLQNLFIDVGQNRDVLDIITINFAWHNVVARPYADAGEDRTMSMTEAHFPEFIVLSDWILKFLGDHTSVVQEDKEENTLVLAVLKMVELLITFGYYVAEEDVRNIAGVLRQLLDGRNDVATSNQKLQSSRNDELLASWRQKERYMQSEANFAVAEVKLSALKCFDVLLNLSNMAILQHLLFDFKFVREKEAQSSLELARTLGSRRNTRVNPRGVELTMTSRQYRSLLTTLLAKPSLEAVLPRYQEVRNYIRDVFQTSDWMTGNWQPEAEQQADDLVSVLVDLANYEHENLKLKAIGLLHRLYRSRDQIFDMAVDAYVLYTEESAQLQATLDKSLPILRLLAQGFVEEEEVEEFVRLLDELTSHCYQRAGDSDSGVHSLHQRIITNCHLQYLILDVVAKNTQRPQGQDVKVMQACARAVRGLAMRNPSMQKLFFKHFELLLGADAANK